MRQTLRFPYFRDFGHLKSPNRGAAVLFIGKGKLQSNLSGAAMRYQSSFLHPRDTALDFTVLGQLRTGGRWNKKTPISDQTLSFLIGIFSPGSVYFLHGYAAHSLAEPSSHRLDIGRGRLVGRRRLDGRGRPESGFLS